MSNIRTKWYGMTDLDVGKLNASRCWLARHVGHEGTHFMAQGAHQPVNRNKRTASRLENQLYTNMLSRALWGLPV